MKICIPIAFVLALAFHGSAHAQQINPTFIENGTNVIGITNIHDIMRDCSQKVGKITVSGVQFSPTGLTLEIIQYLDAQGQTQAIPTAFGDFSNSVKTSAMRFVQKGHSYFVHTQSCGNGGFVNLVSIYDAVDLKRSK